jgi:quercetin dioxygenase-like cupin family protein
MKIIKNLRVSARAVVCASLGLAAVTALVVTAMATPASGIVSAIIVARAAFVDPVDLKFKTQAGRQEVIKASDLLETVIQQIIIGPGGSTGWHTHPGPAVALITSGELTLYSSEDPTCTPRTYLAGQAFIDPGQGHVHLARNLSLSENVEVWVTYFDVPPGGSPRLDAADPGNCGF